MRNWSRLREAKDLLLWRVKEEVTRVMASQVLVMIDCRQHNPDVMDEDVVELNKIEPGLSIPVRVW